MNILIIEDQEDWVKEVAQNAGEKIRILAPSEVHLKGQLKPEKAAEEQLLEQLREIVTKFSIDLVMLDTDLSRARGELQAQSGYRIALQELGVPVCRYQKGGSESKYASWQRLQRIAIDGASAIWIPKDFVSGAQFENLTPWLMRITNGFSAITQRLQYEPSLMARGANPAETLSIVLGRPELISEFLGYSAQNFFFFGAAGDPGTHDAFSDARAQATRLGYWLYNYIMTFPGPILSAAAAAAFTNLDTESFGNKKVQALLENCQYEGPFSSPGEYFWRDRIADVIAGFDGDIARAPSLNEEKLTRIDSSDPSAVAFLCVLSNEPTLPCDAAINPDWIPSGAYQTRIKESHLDQLGPLLGI